jgi:hypothetical protein
MLCFVFCVSASAGFAQEPTTPSDSRLIVGSRVRVTYPQVASRVPGVVESIEDGVLTLRSDGGFVVKVSLASITRVDMSLGRKRSVLQGLAVGGLAGLLISFAMPVDPEACYTDDGVFCSRGEAMVGGVIAMGGIGALIGTFIKRERWARLTIAPSLPVGAGSARLSVAVRF